ncbi:MAG: aminotransferase class III-fold pyridoxal phosphate-dependent enzyme [Parachlamydiaceae bacterium]|nr:aminotransferase class III-fold pyridoxal phosphate-dependent enzyme [Parachlamydiaceae bacterium]
MNHPFDLQIDLLLNDPRVVQAKKLIMETVNEKQKYITGIRPPDPARKENYEKVLARFTEYRSLPLWYPYIGSGIGNGALVELLDGSVKYDFISGIGVHFFGHSHPILSEANIDAALSDIVMQGHLQQNGDCVQLSELMISASQLPHCFLTTSGAMALENGLKLVFQKRFPANRIFAFEHCFCGRTLALAQITDKASFRDGLPATLLVDYIPFFDPLHPKESTQKALEAIKTQLARYPKAYAAMVLELVQGEGGFNVGTTEFFRAIMELLRENQVAILVDEVQSFGRTPQLFAFQHFGLEKYVDICTIGKLSQVCATFFTEEFKPKLGLLSQTFISSTSSIRCSIAILKMLMNSDLYGPQGKNNRFQILFANQLSEIASRNPGYLSGPFGIGAMIAFTPFNGNASVTTKIAHALFEEGLICFIAGNNPTRIRMLPPVPILTENDVIKACSLIEIVLHKSKDLCIS